MPLQVLLMNKAFVLSTPDDFQPIASQEVKPVFIRHVVTVTVRSGWHYELIHTISIFFPGLLLLGAHGMVKSAPGGLSSHSG